MEETKKLGDDLPLSEHETYQAWVQANGYKQVAATRAAIALMQRIPLELRQRAMTGDWAAVQGWFDRADAAWGAFDMFGNVSEWIQDKGNVNYALFGRRGCSGSGYVLQCEAAHREALGDGTSLYTGFRVLRVP